IEKRGFAATDPELFNMITIEAEARSLADVVADRMEEVASDVLRVRMGDSARIRRMKRQFQVLLGRFSITIQHLTDSQPGQRWRTRRVKQRETRCGSILTAV
ncbi:MAG: hypothetical protein WBZ22_27020, partial [Pseudolabrys sp.]